MRHDEVEKVFLDFQKAHNDNIPIKLLIKDNPEDLYGEQYSKENYGQRIFGAYHPEKSEIALFAASFHDHREVTTTLRHELMGHWAINTLEPIEKRALLERIVDARDEPSLSPYWQQVDKDYSKETDLYKAEEIYAFVAELDKSATHTISEPDLFSSEKLSFDELDAITANIENGIREGSRQQQTFPSDLTQFHIKDTPMATNTDPVEKQLRYEMKGERIVTPEDTKSELLEDEAKLELSDDDARLKAETAKKTREDEELRKKIERESILSAQNNVEKVLSGREIERVDMLLPVRIEKSYDEQNGKFFAKDSNRLMFEDKGDKLATSTTDKKAIEDMVIYAKAKQWDSLKLAGSQEFRREAWLQAESQGIKTQGYTPKEADLAALKSLTNSRSTNVITGLSKEDKPEIDKPESQVKAPRHDLNKNQAVLNDEAAKNVTANMQALQKSPVHADKSAEELSKLAYWRGVVMEENKQQPKAKQEEQLAKFDKLAENPTFLKSLEGDKKEAVQKTVERTQTRDTAEHSL